MRSGALRAGVLLALASQFALGCAPYIKVVDRGWRSDGATELSVAVRQANGTLVEDVLVEIIDEHGEVATRLGSKAQPRGVYDLPPGDYTVRVHGAQLGRGVMERDFTLREGQSLAIVYRDRRFGHVAGGVAEVTGDILLVTGQVLGTATLIAAELALIVLTCGCYH